MTIWLDAQLPPSLAPWLTSTFGVVATPVRDIGLRDAIDASILMAAKSAGAIVMTKDADFAEMVRRLEPPPRILWVRCGNTSNAALRSLLLVELPAAMARLKTGEILIEIGSLESP